MMKPHDEPLYPPNRIQSRDGVVHDYWSNCGMWPNGGTYAADDKPITCLVCLAQEVE